jgi:glycosyltransferase involved in cell wall biosynthesis
MTGVAGTEKHLLTLLPGLRSRGVDVRLLVLVESGNAMEGYASQMNALGVKTDVMPIRGDVDLGLFKRLRRYIAEMGAAAVHTHLIHADLHGVVAARRAGVTRVFTTCHNDDPFRKRWVVRRVQRFLWPRITRAIAVSEWLRRHAIEVEGAPPEKVVRIYHGVEVAKFVRGPEVRARMRNTLGIAETDVAFGSICRLTQQKGIGDALIAFKQVAATCPAARYIIVGDGDLKATLEAFVAREGLASRVSFLGWRDDVADLAAAFDVFVNPSRWEGFGLVVLEAMAAGLPVLATRVSALPEIVLDGETGWLVAGQDAAAIAGAMQEACGNVAQARQRGLAGRERARREFGVDQMIDKTLNVYQAE